MSATFDSVPLLPRAAPAPRPVPEAGGEAIWLQAFVRDLVALDRPDDGCVPADPVYFHRLVQAGTALCGALFEAERAGCSRATLRDLLEPVRRMHARAPFISRLQIWPRGYQGDFETIECIWQSRAAGADATSWCLERLALTSPIAQQHRNKVFEQARQIRAAVRRKPARILVLACGGCPDVREASLMPADLADVELVLTDADADALTFARAVLGPVADRCRFERGDVIRALRRATGTFDLILAGGLFDYLTDRISRRVIDLATSRLAADGVFFFTNIAAGNPYRTWIEYFGDWQLLERSEADIHELVANVPGCDASIARDATGLALLVSVRRCIC